MITNFLELLFPNTCVICDQSILKDEGCLCLSCSEDLPFNPTFYDTNGFTTRLLNGRLSFEHATALLLFQKKGVVQKILHELKYKGQEHIGNYFGLRMAEALRKTNWHQEITLVIPVPIHPQRLRKRGYNQVTAFGKCIAEALNVPFQEDILLKSASTKTQVFKGRIARWGFMDEALSIKNADLLEKQHVLLVDDVITTGATIEACGNKLLHAANVKISVASLAITTS